MSEQSVCKNSQCGDSYDIKETIRVFGDAPWIGQYCSAGCYTESTMAKTSKAVSEHTELPWSAHFVSATGIWEVLSAKSEIVAECNTYAEAEYIVWACNAFPAMEKLLEDILEWDGILPHSRTRIKNVLVTKIGKKYLYEQKVED